MMEERARGLLVLSFAICGSAVSQAQIPDHTNSLDPGGAAMGAGGAFYATNADTLSTFWNPAGLGFIGTRRIGITYRNLPTSRSRIDGNYDAPIRTTSTHRGGSTITHVGIAMPMSNVKKGATGNLGISYTVGGTIDDVGKALGGLDIENDVILDYTERRYLRTDFFTVAYGNTNRSQSLAYGVGLAIAQNRMRYSEEGLEIPGMWAATSVSENRTGVGVIAGVQYVPPKSPNVSFAASYRTPIGLGGNPQLYNKVPGRFVLGGAYRKDGLRDGKDYLVAGAQLEHYSAGSRSLKFDRKAQTGLGLGLEYHYSIGTDEIPLRLGYRTIGSGGNDFDGRSAITYGIGYQPGDRSFSLDLSWASPTRGSTDFALSATYRFK